MTAQIQQVMTRDLFQQNTERIKYVVQVNKPQKKKKSAYYLAVVVNNLKNSHHLYLIKKSDQSERYQKDKMWNFDEIQQIDAKHESEETEFEILFTNKQSYKWLTNTANEKSSFLHTIKQIITQSPLYADIKFANMFNGDSAGMVNSQLDEISTSEKMDDPEWNADDSYQALTSREEADLERLLELEVENTINNAEAFTEKLSRDLASMDSSNIQDIMASEQRVIDLMAVLQNAVDETFRLENKIIYYESLLKNVRDIVQKVEKKEAIVQIYNDNNNRLLNEVGQLILNLDFKPEYEYILDHCNLNSTDDLPKCLEAAWKLQEAIQHQAPIALQSLSSVTEQKEYLLGISKKFGYRIKGHISELMGNLVSSYQGKLAMRAHESVLVEHSKAHRSLIPYAPFVKWLREIDGKMYSNLVETYIGNFSGIYEKEFSYFFEYLRDRYVYSSVKGNTSLISPSPTDAKRKSLAVTDFKGDFRRNSYANSSQSDTVETASTRSSDISLTEWEEFDSYIEFMLKTIDPVCHAEQQFCNQFFDLEAIANLSIPSTPVMGKHGSISETDTSLSNHSSNYSEQSASGQAKRNDQLRNILSELFRSFESEFISFVLYYDKVDGIYSLYFLVRLNGHVMAASDTGSFLSKAYGNILIHIKRSFDRYMLAQQTEIEEAKDPKRTKVGILPFIKRFETFAKQTENVVKYGPQRRADIDRWYVTLMEKIFQSIARIAKEHQRVYKTPSQMIELENYHYIQLMLPSLKIPCLENERKEAKVRYNNALNEYVNLYFRRPLEKLNCFFEGVQSKVQQGVREEEISYQLAYSKQELRKVIKDCNLKDIKKGLEEMYKRVEKHISDPANNLIQVIWRSMQEEFITQYKSISEMIERCYPQANITLLFSIEDVLNVFSEIAQMH